MDWTNADEIRAYMATRLQRALDAAAGPETQVQRLTRIFHATNRRRGIFGFTAAQRRAIARATREDEQP